VACLPLPSLISSFLLLLLHFCGGDSILLPVLGLLCGHGLLLAEIVLIKLSISPDIQLSVRIIKKTISL